MIDTISLEEHHLAEIKLLQDKSTESGIPICILNLVRDIRRRTKWKISPEIGTTPLLETQPNSSNDGFYRDLLD